MTDRTTRRLLSERRWEAALGVLLGIVAIAPAFDRWDSTGWGDWGWFHHSWEVGRVSLLRFGEIPLWDPHHCGGVSMWGQPQAQVFAPTWWITGLPFGTEVGHKLFIVLHFAVGFTGALTFARRAYGFSTAAACLGAVAWAFSGYFGWRASGGHATFLAFHYLPWILLFWRRAHDRPRYAAVVALGMALVLFEGGTYAFPFTFLVLLCDVLVSLTPPKPRWEVLRTALLAGSLTAMLGAMRLVPVFRTMARFPRKTELEDSQTLAHLLESLTAREPHPWHWGHRWVWAEYGSYVGWAVLALAGYGALFALRRRGRWHLLFGALIFGALAMGNVDAHWPWPLLHELPMFGSFHVPSRFHVLLTFYLALLATLAVDRALRAVRGATLGRGAQAGVVSLAWLLVAAVALDVVSNDVRIASRWGNPPIEGEPASRFHLVGPQGYLDQYMTYPRRHVGTQACYDPLPWRVSSALWIGDMVQARVSPPTAGEVHSTARTNHTFEARVTLTEPARVVVNQNFDPDWRLSVGTPVEDRGRLATDLPAGDHLIIGTYQPPDLPWSVLVTLLGLALSVGLWLFRPRGRVLGLLLGKAGASKPCRGRPPFGSGRGGRA